MRPEVGSPRLSSPRTTAHSLGPHQPTRHVQKASPSSRHKQLPHVQPVGSDSGVTVSSEKEHAVCVRKTPSSPRLSSISKRASLRDLSREKRKSHRLAEMTEKEYKRLGRRKSLVDFTREVAVCV